MKVLCLDGQIRPWDLRSRKEKDNPSSGHLQARLLLRDLFPVDLRLEEVSIPGTLLHVDFFLPGRGLMVEVQGEQHDQRNVFFHPGEHDFLQSAIRDRQKEEFCQRNNLRLVQLATGGTIDEWTRQILGEDPATGQLRDESGTTTSSRPVLLRQRDVAFDA